MRDLSLKDVMTMARIMKKANSNDAIINIMKKIKLSKKNNGNGITEQIGTEVFLAILEVCADKGIEEEIYVLLDGIMEEKTAEMPLTKLIENLKEMVKRNNINDFFKQAGQLTQ